MAKAKEPKEKTLSQKMADVVDHIIHPKPPEVPEQGPQNETEISAPESSSQVSELQNHPKFDKFKKGDN